MRPKLLKLSGECLGGDDGIFAPAAVDRVCAEVVQGARGGPLGVVVGGGNIIRGRHLVGRCEPTRADGMGMLATLINALALVDGIERVGGKAVCVGPQPITNACRGWDRPQVMEWLAAGVVVVFGGGTGHPFFTTDTAAALRAAEIDASELLKGSNVDGIYTADPRKDPTAKRFERLTFDQAVEGRYGVMDAAAFALCRERRVPIRVFDMNPPGAITAALGPNPPGTVVG